MAGLLGALGAGLLLELGGQVHAARNPAWDVVAWEPDPGLGWRLVPGLRFTWAGHEWYARDYAVEVTVNALGFRDRERRLEPAPGALRVALLGDSFLEGIQVPLEATCAQRLEARLGARHAGAEVLNLAVSNWGVGQALLCWEQVARRGRPDWVVVLVAERQMARTVRADVPGRFGASQGQTLAIRPVFRRRGWALEREPPRDLDRLRALQEEVIADELGGARVRRRGPRPFLLPRLRDGLLRLLEPATPSTPGPEIDGETWEVNRLVLASLARQVREAGARLVVMDACAWFNPGGATFSSALAELCAQERALRLDLSSALEAAEARGESLLWAHDAHWTPAGHEAAAAALDELLRAEGS